MNDVNIESLGTVAGASVVAALVVQSANTFFNLTVRGKRQISLAVGFIVVVGMTIASIGFTFVGIVLASVVGLQSGLAASQAYAVVRDGISHNTASDK